MPSRNFTVRPAPVEALPASRADAPDEVTNELSATQSPLNSRRFSSLVSLPFTMRSLPLRRSCSDVKMVQPNALWPADARSRSLGCASQVWGGARPRSAISRLTALSLKRASQAARPASGTMTITTCAATATITTEAQRMTTSPTVELATDAA